MKRIGRHLHSKYVTVRNEAGHPSNIDPVTYDTVHASLLIFPELANLVNELSMWITSYNSKS